MKMSRRRVLCGAAGVLAAGRVAALAAEPDPEKAPLPGGDLAIVDTHQHLWDLNKFEWPWLKGSPLDRSFVTKDYREAKAGLNLVAAVDMETDVAERYQRAEAEYIVEICRRGDAPTRAVVIGGPVESEGFRKSIMPFKAPTHRPTTSPGYSWSRSSVCALSHTNHAIWM
jgi:hypothetical protein